jgi:hypothetical protein
LRTTFFVGLVLLVGCSPHQQKSESPPDAASARETVKVYFSLIRQRKFGDAYRMWGNDGGDTRGSVADFVKSLELYGSYVAEVGDPTEIKTSAGQAYVAVAAKVRVTMKPSGAASDRSGTVMLRRPAKGDGEWRIWGTDIRARN